VRLAALQQAMVLNMAEAPPASRRPALGRERRFSLNPPFRSIISSETTQNSATAKAASEAISA
jgi:hypothetical protein